MLVHIGIYSALLVFHLPQHHLLGRYILVVDPSVYYYKAWIRVALFRGFPDSRNLMMTLGVCIAYF